MTNTRLPASPASLAAGDRVTNVSFPQWGPATVQSVQTTDDGKVYIAARYDATGKVWSGVQSAYARVATEHNVPTGDIVLTADDNEPEPAGAYLRADETDDFRTWSFAGSEGSAHHVTASQTHLTITSESRYPDGGGSDETLEFVTWTDAAGWPIGTHVNAPRCNTRVLVDPATDLRDAWADALQDALGFATRTMWLTDQPEPLDY